MFNTLFFFMNKQRLKCFLTTTDSGSLLFLFFKLFLDLRACSLVVRDLRSETKGSRLESGCQLYAEVSSLQQSPGQCLSACEAGGSGREELNR